MDPGELDSALDLLAPMALLAFLSAVPLAAVAYSIGRVADRSRVAESALGLAIGATLLFGLLWVAGLNQISAWRSAPGSALLKGGIVSAGAFLAAIGVRRIL